MIYHIKKTLTFLPVFDNPKRLQKSTVGLEI